MDALYIDLDTGKVRPFEHAEQLRALEVEALHAAPLAPREDAMDLFRTRKDLAELATKLRALDAPRLAMLKSRGLRLDAIEIGNALALPLELQHFYNRELEERLRPLRGMELFKRDASVPPGPTSYKIARGFGVGEAKIYAGSAADIPTVNVSRRAESRPIRYVVTSYSGNVIDLAATDWAGLDEMGRKRRQARRAIDELINRLIWYGNSDAEIYGMVTYPDLNKYVSSVAFDGTATAAAMLAELNRIANFAHDESSGAFRSNRLATTHRIRSLLFSTPMFATGGSDLTVGKYFLQNQEFIKSIESAAELKAIGPGSTDGIFAYNDEVDSSSFVMPQDYTELPQQFLGFERKTYCYASFGGARMNNAGDNLLAYVDGAP